MRQNLVLNSLIHNMPVKRFENRSEMMKFWSSSDVTVSRIENKMKTVDLSTSSWKIKQKRVAIVEAIV